MERIEYKSILISALLEQDKKFSLVLPHFQRGFVWDNKGQKALLLSLLAGVPVGYILILKDKKDAYYSRPLCFDLDTNIQSDTCQYLLDGQQRISTMKSMFTDMSSVEEKNRFNDVQSIKDLRKSLPPTLQKRWFLQIDGKADDGKGESDDIFCLETLSGKFGDVRFMPMDFDGYVVHTPMKEEYASTDNGTTTIQKIQRHATEEKRLPLWMLNNRHFLRVILNDIAKEHHAIEKSPDEESKSVLEGRIAHWADAVVDFLHDNLLGVSMGMLVVPSAPDNGGMNVGISIFEQVNRQGTRLDVYDLLVARVADREFNLTNKIKAIVERSHPVLPGITNTQTKWSPDAIGIWDKKNRTLSRAFRTLFKNCLPISVLNAKPGHSLSDIKNEDIKEKSLLALKKDEIKKNWEDTVRHVLHVLQFLHFRCGLEKIRDIPYELLVVPLFVCFIEQSKKGDYPKEFIDNLEFWWWASIFSGHYRDRHGPKVVEDSKRFLIGERFHDRMDLIFKKEGYSDESTLVNQPDGQRSARLNLALKQYVLSKEPYDLQGKKVREKITAFKIANRDVTVHKHHVIPLGEMATNGTGKLRKDISNRVNGPLNFILVSAKTNYKIMRVSDYRQPPKQVDCDSNLMPVPSERKYTSNPDDELYPLTRFLRDRFHMIKKNVKEHLIKLIAK
ncbi:MAG: DUF262 domain-containing protein [Gammaproteobacteria bacterium]